MSVTWKILGTETEDTTCEEEFDFRALKTRKQKEVLACLSIPAMVRPQRKNPKLRPNARPPQRQRNRRSPQMPYRRRKRPCKRSAAESAGAPCSSSRIASSSSKSRGSSSINRKRRPASPPRPGSPTGFSPSRPITNG